MALQDENCSPVQADTPHLADEEIRKLMVQVEGWQQVEAGGEKQISRQFKFKDFKQAMEFTNRVAELADRQDHHPAILTEYGKVTITWWTHRIKGLSRNDFIMAAKTNSLLQQ